MHHVHPLFSMFFVLLTFTLGVAVGTIMLNATKSGKKKNGRFARLEARLEALERKA
jgi:Na+-driven multidrug efflux pump